MAYIPSELKAVRDDLEAGQQRSATVRQLLRWFCQYRRGARVVAEINEALRRVGLSTDPHFAYSWIDDVIRFNLKTEPTLQSAPVVSETPSSDSPSLPSKSAPGNNATDESVEPQPTFRTLEIQDPSFSIGKLASAHRYPLTVKPDTPVIEAITLMLTHNYSQLPVMQSNRAVKGLFSWKSYARRLVLQSPCDTVSEAMEQVTTVSSEASIFQVADLLSRNAAVLVIKSASDPQVTGIVAASDLAEHFARLGEPFLLIGEIENRVRLLIDGNFTVPELAGMKDPSDRSRDVRRVADLTFGEYIRLLQTPENWERCKLRVHRPTFIKQLERVRGIRNDVMHFDNEELDSESLGHLRAFAELLRQLASPRGKESTG